LVAQKSMTVVIVAHRLSTVKKADKICVIVVWRHVKRQGVDAEAVDGVDGCCMETNTCCRYFDLHDWLIL
jgi:ABC-type thiamine transport system ATPase subunit